MTLSRSEMLLYCFAAPFSSYGHDLTVWGKRGDVSAETLTPTRRSHCATALAANSQQRARTRVVVG